MRKKLPLISGILNVLEKLKGNTGIIENTSVATHTIAAGKYVIWKNDLYKASSAISIGDTLSLSNLTAVSDGIANELNSKTTWTFIDSKSGSAEIQLPNDFSELCVFARLNNSEAICGTAIIPKNVLKETSRTFRYGYCSSVSGTPNFMSWQIAVTNTTIKLETANVSGSNVLSNSLIEVYAR